MSFREKSIGVKLGSIGLVIFPLVYIVLLIVNGDPDFIIFTPGPFGFIFWIVQWVTFLIGGWIAAVIATILLLALIGYLVGRLAGWIISLVLKNSSARDTIKSKT